MWPGDSDPVQSFLDTRWNDPVSNLFPPQPLSTTVSCCWIIAVAMEIQPIIGEKDNWFELEIYFGTIQYNYLGPAGRGGS